jgi:acetyltransferase-like isoleucine patch superfamily enzyme
MKARELLFSGRHNGVFKIILSAAYFRLKQMSQISSNIIFMARKIILKENAKIAIHHKTNLKLENSKIIVANGKFSIGIKYGYYDGGGFDSKRDVCRIHLINSTLRINGNVDLYPGVQIFAINAEISIGDHTKINGGTQIIALNKIEIGSNCFFAQGVLIRDNDGHKLSFDGKPPVMNIQPIKIGNHCWIGQRAMLLKGTEIGDNAIIAAGAIVTKNVSKGTLVGGVPAKIISERVVWEE